MPVTWSESERFVPRRVVRPLQRVMDQAASGAVAMAVATVAALVVANTGLVGWYDDLWSTPVGVTVGGFDGLDHLDLRGWVNDGLMTLFFLLVALELKRERTMGHLQDTRAAIQPIVAAAGGMLVPAAIYLLFNAGTAAQHGWGIPVATDIVFAVAVVTALGPRVPPGARVFLLTLAVVDDLGGIIVIAVFYTAGLAWSWLALAVACVGAAALLQRLNVRAIGVFVLLGAGCWLALLLSGVHPTMAGVAFGLLAPARPFHDPALFERRVRSLLGRIDRAAPPVDHEAPTDDDRLQSSLRDIRRLAVESQSPLGRTELRLAPYVAFGVVPLFAFANAGISLPSDFLTQAATDRVALGVGLGLLIGKPVGIVIAVLLLRMVRVPLPQATSWYQLTGVAMLAGVGFTVALFLGEIAFDDDDLARSAKAGILIGSLGAALLGYAWLRRCSGAGHRATAPALPAAEVSLADATTRESRGLGNLTNVAPAPIDSPVGPGKPRA